MTERCKIGRAHFVTGFIVLTCVCSVGFGQGIFGGSFPSDRTEILRELMGTNFSFSATAHLDWRGKTNSFKADLSCAVLKRNLRAGLTISNTPDLEFSPAALANAQRCGLDHTIQVVRPDKWFFLYTNLKASVDLGQMKQSENVLAQFKFRKVRIGTETVNGHPCVKYDVLAVGLGRSISTFVWEATDLRSFPIRMEWTDDEENRSRIDFSNIDFSEPQPQLFEIPAGYKRYGDFGELVKSACKEPDGGNKK